MPLFNIGGAVNTVANILKPKPVGFNVGKGSNISTGAKVGSGAGVVKKKATPRPAASNAGAGAYGVGKKLTTSAAGNKAGTGSTLRKPSQSYSGSSGGGTSYSGGGGSSFAGLAGAAGGVGQGGVGAVGGDLGGVGGISAPVAPPLEQITVPDPLADPDYQRVKAELMRTLAGFEARDKLARGQYQGTVDTNMRQMGWRNGGFDPQARGTAYGSAFENNIGDFAGRGMVRSGLFAQSLSDLNNDFTDRRSGILTSQKDWTDTQDLSKQNFMDEQRVADESAISDAIAAIAAKYAVNTGDVVRGRTNTVTR